MAATIVATIGASNANSYLTLVEAESYFETRLHADDWNDALDANKTIALIQATRVMDAMWEWEGSATSDTQALQWPRIGMEAANRLVYLDDDVIPTELKNATAELAMQLLAEDRTLDSDIESKKINSITAGPVSLSFGEGVTAKVIPDSVYHLIPPWWGWVRGRRGGMHPAVRS